MKEINSQDPYWGFDSAEEVVSFLCQLLDRGIGKELLYKYRWDEREVLPKVKKIKRSPKGLTIEIFGLSRAGKTTIKNLLIVKFPQINFVEELQLRGRAVLKDFGQDFPFAQRNFIAQIVKQSAWLELFRKAIEGEVALAESKGKKPLPEHTVIYRGANDVLCMDRFLFALEGGHFLGSRERTLQGMLSGLLSSAYMAQQADAVVLFGVSFETAVKRRVNAGLPAHGKIVNPNVWPYVATGYTWWENNFWPFLRREFGTGLLVVDGEQSIQHNFERVQSYLEKCLNRFDSIRS